MIFMKKAKALFLTAILMLVPCLTKASELSNEEKNYLKAMTAEWEFAFGPLELWDYRMIGLFCQLYKNYPNAETAKELTSLPTLPYTEVNVSCEEATEIARSFLIDYDPRITASYLDSLGIGTTFFDLSYTEESLSARCDRIWIIKFFEQMSSGEYLMRCDCYLDADTGKVFMIDLNLNGKDPRDFDDYQLIEIK